MWLADDLIAAVKRRVFAPSTQGTWTDSDILALADEEIQGRIVPLVMSAREEFYVWPVDVPITSLVPGGVPIRIPPRAIGNKLRDLCLIDASGGEVRYPRVSPDDIAYAPHGFYLQGGQAILFSSQSTVPYPTARLRIYLRPSSLVVSTDTSKVQALTGVTPTTKTVTVAVAYSTANLYDFIRHDSPFDTLGFDLVQASGTTSPVMAAALPSELQVGDWMCLAGYTPVPQIPVEMQPVLAQAVACKMLEAMGDSQGLDMAQAKLQETQGAALELITARVDGEPKKIQARYSPFRRRW